jgi:hypothetical protein
MKIADLLSGRADFASKREVIEFIKNSKNFDASSENTSQSDALLIFSTSKQHTWLVASSVRLYCLLDDLRNDAPHVNWSIHKAKLISADAVTLKLSVRDKTEYTGLLAIEGVNREWLYTKRLFSDAPIEQKIKDLLRAAMIDGATK